MRNNKAETQQRQELASKAGEFMIGNDLRVTRLGFGAMRTTGDGIWGEPAETNGHVSRRRAVPSQRNSAIPFRRPDTGLVHARRHIRTASSAHLGSILR